MADDIAHKAVDKRITALEKKLAREYKAALKEMEIKANNYLNHFRSEDKIMRYKLIHGEIDSRQYRAWRKTKMLGTKRYNELIDRLANDLSNANNIANKFINATLPYSFMDGANFTAYTVEKVVGNVTFSIYNINAVNELLKENPIYLPTANIDFPKDIRWNKQRINSALAQGILQGESIPKIAKRLMRVTDMTDAAANRNARTLHNAAENIGRMDTYKRAESMGIDMQRQWIATHDNRTRDAHRELDGVITDLDKPFWNSIGKIRYPSDPHAHPANVYNCRCYVIGVIKGHPYKTTRYDGENYAEWKKGKASYADYLKGK